MFDSPLADKVPGELVRFGVPRHGLVEAPTLTTFGSVPATAVRLTTWGGRVITPFGNGADYLAGTGGNLFFRRAGALDSGEDEAGVHWYGATSFNAWNIGEVALGSSWTNAFGYDSGDACHVVRFSTQWCVVYPQRVYARVKQRAEGFSFSDIQVPHDPAGLTNLPNANVADVTFDGRQVLLMPRAEGVIVAAISGVYPDIRAMAQVRYTPTEYNSSSYARVVTGEHGEGYRWRFDATAHMGWSIQEGYDPYVIVLDMYVGNGVIGSLFDYPYSVLTTRLNAGAIFPYFAAGQATAPATVGLLRYERTERIYDDFQTEWGVDATLITLAATAEGRFDFEQNGAKIDAHLNRDQYGEIEFQYRLLADTLVVSSLELEHSAHYKRHRATVSGTGMYADSGAVTDSNEDSLSLALTLDGRNLLADWSSTGALAVLLDAGYNEGERWAELNDAAVSGGGASRKFLITVSHHLYSNQLACLKVVMTETTKANSAATAVVTVKTYFGNAFHRGAIDAGVTKFDGNPTANSRQVFGSGCALTGRVTRNKLYPVLHI